MSDISKVIISLRSACFDDVNLLRYWDTQPHIIACDPNDDWQWEIELQRNPPWREQLIAEINGRPLGFIQIIDPAFEDSHYWGDVPHHLRAIDIWIGETADLNQGYGTQMMNLAIAKCFTDCTVTAILVDPLANNIRAHRFYKRFGFKLVERKWFGDDDCFIYRLKRENWQA